MKARPEAVTVYNQKGQSLNMQNSFKKYPGYKENNQMALNRGMPNYVPFSYECFPKYVGIKEYTYISKTLPLMGLECLKAPSLPVILFAP